MKDRFLLLVSLVPWAAFAWFLFICYAVVATFYGYTGIEDFHRLLNDDEFLMSAAISPAVWFATWFVTGSPRILPWRKPSQTAKEG